MSDCCSKEAEDIQPAAACCADPAPLVADCCASKADTLPAEGNVGAGFWKDPNAWKRAARNTMHCLIGCSIGDYGMLIYLQMYHPGTSPMTMMILAMIAGICTSIALETLILMKKEEFGLKKAFTTALNMSLVSMIAMELSMNITDYGFTGFDTSPATIFFWVAIALSTVVGYLVPLPYNYYKIKKHGKSCH
jgi:hypothetical protein